MAYYQSSQNQTLTTQAIQVLSQCSLPHSMSEYFMNVGPNEPEDKAESQQRQPVTATNSWLWWKICHEHYIDATITATNSWLWWKICHEHYTDTITATNRWLWWKICHEHYRHHHHSNQQLVVVEDLSRTLQTPPSQQPTAGCGGRSVMNIT